MDSQKLKKKNKKNVKLKKEKKIMNREQLFEQIRKKKSFLCVGLDPDIEKMPRLFYDAENPLFEFNKAIIGATHEFAIAYKPNLAFYERYGSHGIHQLELTLQYIRMGYPEMFVIADAKRGDIGNTSKMYAKAFFDSPSFNYDAVTVAPYIGEDSVKPFLEFPDKWVILLALTSNKGSFNFQHNVNAGSRMELYQEVLVLSQTWGNKENMMYVIGATQAKALIEVRKLVPDHFLLIPGVGAQGGSLEEVAKYGMNDHCGLIVNSSRDIIYAGKGPKFMEAVKDVAWKKYQQPMEMLLRERKLIE
jgi:orotidine-5'-phosphate decarboxylase